MVALRRGLEPKASTTMKAFPSVVAFLREREDHERIGPFDGNEAEALETIHGFVDFGCGSRQRERTQEVGNERVVVIETRQILKGTQDLQCLEIAHKSSHDLDFIRISLGHRGTLS
mgnify:CR=1 FL=1